ncbi:MAG: ureidoglycolate lyase [Alphaproteobacteria bacterium]
MARVIELAVEPLTEEAFRPFGAIVGAAEAPAPFRLGTMETWKTPFEATGAVEMTVCRYHREAIEWSRMERHLAVTQAFLPLAGVATLMAVAPPSAEDDPSAAPPPDAMRAFRMDGAVGVMLWRGTWHALRRFPIAAPFADIVLLTGRETQAEIERRARDGTPTRLTHEVDYAERFGVRFRAAGL